MKVLFLTKYAALAASSRYRVFQYLPYLEDAGWSFEVQSLLTRGYVIRRYSGERLGSASLARQILGSMLQRASLLVRRAQSFDAVYVQSEVLPYIPWLIERPLVRRIPALVLDYDDAIFVNYDRASNKLVRVALAGKIAHLTSIANGIVLGSAHLARMMSLGGPRVTVIPTSVQMEHYRAVQQPARDPNDRCIRVGWIGTPVTAPFLHILDSPLARLATIYDIELRVIGAPSFSMPGVRCVNVPWSCDTEVAELKACDIGVMPLPRSPFAEGKSGLKLIQYLASGIPAVGSAIGANREIILHEETGLLVDETDSDQAWYQALERLIVNPALRQQLSTQGQLFAYEHFTVERNVAHWKQAIVEAVNARVDRQ